MWGSCCRVLRLVTGSSQADKLLEVIATGSVKLKKYKLNKSIRPVFLKAYKRWRDKNLDLFKRAESLESHYKTFTWVNNNTFVNETEDYLSSLGIIALQGTKEVIEKDYIRVREMEKSLIIE